MQSRETGSVGALSGWLGIYITLIILVSLSVCSFMIPGPSMP